jgi:large subunit ribosomal protein L6
MSRLGKKAIEIPSGVNISINGRKVSVSKGDTTLEYEHRPEVRVNWDEGEKSVTVTIDEKDAKIRTNRAYWGLTRALIANMVEGVTKGFEKKLEVVGVGYNAQVQGQKMALKVGFANTIEVPIPMGVNVDVSQSIITIKGADKHAVGQFAAMLRSKRKPEPYNGKGIRYYGEEVRRKQGKAFGA